MLTIVCFCLFQLAVADYGGHDLFTSLSQLNELWKNERLVVQDMRNIIEHFEQIQNSIKRYIKSHEELKLNQEPNFEYLGHPLNSYQFVRHAALGWEEMRSVLPVINASMEIFDRLQKREEMNKLPDLGDVSGAAYGLARLHSLYGINSKQMVENGVIMSTFENGIKALSKPSIKKLQAWDINLISMQSWENGLYNTLTDLQPFVLDMLDAENQVADSAEGGNLFLQVQPNRTEVEKQIRMGRKMHDEVLIRRGSRGGNHRTHEIPVDPELKKKKKYRKPFSLGTPFINEADVVLSRQQESPEATLKGEIQKEMLCAGETFRDPRKDADLHCIYAHNNSPWLKLGPMKVEVKSKEPYLAVLRELMYPHECDNITQFLGPHLDFPPGRMSHRAAKNDWTMKNAWPTEDDNVYLEKLTRRVEHVASLLASSSKGQSDRFMCGNYGIGGHYGTHPDFYNYDMGKLLDPMDNGNRVATVMAVLEAPEAGGATVWPYLGVSVFPEKGSAAMWFNTKSDAIPDQLTLHAACPVLLGQKWIGNKWIGYKPQWQQRPCGLQPETRMNGPLF